MALMQINFFSTCLMRQITINAIVPVDKMLFPGMTAREKKPFKTLYLLHGIFGNYTDWLTETHIKAWAEERDLVVIMPSGDNSFYLDNEKSGGMYGEFIGRELVDITRSMFHLSDKREDTYIAGLSMGGYGAIRNGLKYSETFGYIAGLSSALVMDSVINSTDDVPTLIGKRSYFESVFGNLDELLNSDKDPRVIVKSLKDKGSSIPDMYVCCGTEDFLINENRGFHKFLDDNEVVHTYVEDPGAHTWEYWDEHILKVFDWLPLEKPNMGVSSGNVK